MTKIIAHRGYSGKFPENTMLAFHEAAKHSIFGIEIDVHLTKDQEVVIIHDEAIDRTSNGKGFVKDLRLADLRQFDYFGDFPETQETHKDLVQIPTLAEFLAWLKTTDLVVNIELKTNIFRYEGINQKVLDLIVEHDLFDRVIISSFNHHSVCDFKNLAQDLPIGYGFLTACGMLEPGTYCKQYGMDYYHPVFISLEKEDIQNCHDQGIEINTWTVNEVEQMQGIISAGVDCIITNYVERALELV